MKGIDEQIRGEFSSLTKRDLFALCRRSKIQPKVVTEWLQGKKTITLRTVAKLLNEKQKAMMTPMILKTQEDGTRTFYDMKTGEVVTIVITDSPEHGIKGITFNEKNKGQ